MKMNLTKLSFALFCGLFFLLSSCDKEEQGIGEDPYAGGKEPLGIKLASDAPFPEAAYPGAEVVFGAEGLLAWCDPGSDQYDFNFFIAGEEAEIRTATDTSLTVTVPASVSSGITHILLQGQVFYGPNFNVLGNVKTDHEYGLKTGTNGVVFNYLEHASEEGSYYLLGGFNIVEGERRTSLAYVDDRGFLADQNSSRYKVEEPLRYTLLGGGFGGQVQESLSSLSYFSDGKVLLSGTFGHYELEEDEYAVTNNITVLEEDMALDTMMVTVLPSRWSSETEAAVPRFNGGTLQPILRSFVTSDDKVIAVGNIRTYARVDYSQSTAIENVYEYTDIASVIRMDRSGELDDAYRAGGVSGAENINDAYLDEDDGVVIVGDFDTFDGQPAHSIARLTADGNIDEAYLANAGSGANGSINMVRYNKSLGKAVVVGQFTEFNGQPRNGVAVLNKDGSLDETFKPRVIEGGDVNFATILDNEKIVISGTFLKYDGVSRPGFLILDQDGAATQRFNVPGMFTGQLYQAVETKTTTGANGLLLMGNFSRFNGERVNNVVMLEVDFED